MYHRAISTLTTRPISVSSLLAPHYPRMPPFPDPSLRPFTKNTSPRCSHSVAVKQGEKESTSSSHTISQRQLPTPTTYPSPSELFYQVSVGGSASAAVYKHCAVSSSLSFEYSELAEEYEEESLLLSLSLRTSSHRTHLVINSVTSLLIRPLFHPLVHSHPLSLFLSLHH